MTTACDIVERLRSVRKLGLKTPMLLSLHEEAADEIALLRSIIRDLDIQVMQPRMDGNHQCSVKSQGRLLSHDQWGAVVRAEQ